MRIMMDDLSLAMLVATYQLANIVPVRVPGFSIAWMVKCW